MMHAKTATIDATWSTIGSYNFDAQSRFTTSRSPSRSSIPTSARRWSRASSATSPNCEPYDESAWNQLPWWRKALAWLAFRFRRFL